MQPGEWYSFQHFMLMMVAEGLPLYWWDQVIPLKQGGYIETDKTSMFVYLLKPWDQLVEFVRAAEAERLLGEVDRMLPMPPL